MKKCSKLRTGLILIVSLLASTSSQIFAAEIERELFDDRYCTTCHGTDGKGNEGVQAPRLAGMEDWYLKRQLEIFRAGIRGTHPEDREGIAMQPMAAKLTDESIADVVEWVGSWPYVPAEITITGDEAAGQRLYAACATCHGDRAQGNESLGAPALAGQNDWYLVTQLKNYMAGYRGHHPDDSYGQQMRAMAQSLGGEAGILNVVAYINAITDR